MSVVCEVGTIVFNLNGSLICDRQIGGCASERQAEEYS